MGEAAKIIEHRYTYADMQRWPEEDRWELVNGVPLAMSPATGRLHQLVVRNLFRQLDAASMQGGCQAFFAPFDVRLDAPVAAADDAETTTVVQPDILVVCDTARLDDMGCKGPADLVVEVVSPASVLRDNIAKLALYERFGVREYWIAHPVDRLLFQRILEPCATGSRYGIPAVHGPEDQVPCVVLPGFVLDLRPVFEQDSEQQGGHGPPTEEPSSVSA